MAEAVAPAITTTTTMQCPLDILLHANIIECWWWWWECRSSIKSTLFLLIPTTTTQICFANH
eukprot:scaffold1259_cov102-Cylindrotheca_fusiformis.AAC.2